jgi:vitamin B12 transporter
MAGAVDYALNLSGFENDGISAKTAPGFVEDDGYRNLTLHGVFGVSLGPDLRVEAAGRYVDARAEFDGFFGEDNVLYTEQASGRLQVSGASGDKRVSGQLAASYMTQNRADYENGAPFLFGSRFDSERTRLEALGRWTVADGHDLAAGADFEDESAVTDALSRGRTIAGIFLDYQGRVAPGTFVTLGARFDDHEEFGQHLSWRATAAHRLAGTAAWSLTAKASAGTGFRAPSLFELYDGFSGDPSLKEETGIGWDLGLDWNGAEWGLDASMAYFDQRIEDEIRFDPNLFVYVQNPATARSRGVETSLSAALTQALRFSGTYTYTHAEIGSQDAEDGLPRPRRPRHIASASLDYVFGEGRGGVTATVRTAAGHEDGFFVFRTPLDARAVFDLSARYRVTGGLTLTLRGQNILDERYAEAAGFSAPRAAMFAGADWRF